MTGVGAVSACGVGADALWDAAICGRTAVREVAFPDIRRQSVSRAAKIPDEIVAALIAHSNSRLQDPVATFALAAAREAIEQAGLGPNDFGSQCGVVVGSGFGGAATVDRNYFRFFDDPPGRIDPMSVAKTMANASASWIAMTWKATGPTYCISTACSSASQSIGLAANLIRAGAVERCVAGGAEAMLVTGTFAAWEALHVMTSTACRPFSAGRNGMVLGEGAGVLVLESLEAARRRGATVLAEIAGYGTTTDAVDLLRPDATGAADAMRKALEDGGLSPADIGYVNAHGTGTVLNDVTEAQAMREVFGPSFEGLAVSSTKPVHGHALGAAGALELIIALCALRAHTAPPTINFEALDPKIGFEPIPDGPKPFAAAAVMSNSFAFGGVNASLILTRTDG